MIRIEGTAEWVDMGAGGWELITDDGIRYSLICEKAALSSGERVRVTGKKQSAFGFMMRGHDVIEVTQIIRLDATD